MDTNETLLRAILATVARQTFPPETLHKIVAPTAASRKQLAAYNLCDGNTPQTEIAKKAKLDKGNLNRALARWAEEGVLIRVGKEQFPLHLYPLTRATLSFTSEG